MRARRVGPGVAVLILVSMLPSGASAQTADDLRVLLERARGEAGAPGAILGVQIGERPVVVVADGYLDLDETAEIAPDQPFYIGSASKTYTAALVLRLAERGELSLEQTLDHWLPDFPRGDEITLRHLLDHTSGLKDFYAWIYFRPERQEMIDLVTRSWSETELIELSGRFGHWFDPGDDWSYSSTNYYLLGVVIERVSGLPLESAYRSYIYEPLGLERTWLARHEPALGPFPVGHLGPVEGWSHSEMFGELAPTTRLDDSEVEWAAGGLVAPADELVVFLRGLFSGAILNETSRVQMTDFLPSPPLGIRNPDDAVVESEGGYGLGLIRIVRDGVRFVGHGGLFTGHTAGVWHVTECDLTIALYFNRGFVGQRKLLDRVVDLVENRTGRRCSTVAAGR